MEVLLKALEPAVVLVMVCEVPLKALEIVLSVLVVALVLFLLI